MRSDSEAFAVNMMIGVRRVWFSRRRRRHNSIPPMPGSIKSRTITIGGFCLSRASARPCSPVEATTAKKPSDSRLYLTLSAISASSSMMRAGFGISLKQSKSCRAQLKVCEPLTNKLNAWQGALQKNLVAVLDNCSLRHINGQLADVRDVITDALEMFSHEQQPRVTGGCRRLFGHQFDQVVKDLIIEIVNFRVAFDYLM